MWMPKESHDLGKVAGDMWLAGKVVSRIENPQTAPAGFFSGSQPIVSLFRLQEEPVGPDRLGSF